jgi:hypothetical protein
MHPALQFTLEAHTAAATLYLHGTLQPQSAVGAFRACYNLPPAVRRLYVDLRGVSALLPGTSDTVEILLDEWRRARGGETCVARPPAVRRAS